MRFTVIFETIILLGTIQGFIISALLFFGKQPRLASRLLGVLLFLMSLASLCLYASFNDWFGSATLVFWSNFIPMIIIMPFGPLIFFYVRACLDPGFKMGRRQQIHFYPVILDFIPYLAAIIFVLGISSGILENNPRPWVNFIDQYNVYSDIPRWISVTVYLWLSERYLSGLKNPGFLTAPGKTATGTGQEANILWLRQFIRIFLAFQLIWLFYLVPYVIPRYTDFMLDTFDWYPVYVPMAVLIYWLGIKGYSMSHRLVSGPAPKGSPSQSLPVDTVRASIDLLRKAMEEDRLFLDPSLNLQRLSAHTGLQQKMISAVLNQHIRQSFNEFVNSYRISEVKTMLLKPENKPLTIAAIAFDAGFNSLATFQRAFKATENMTPKEFLSLHQKSNA